MIACGHCGARAQLYLCPRCTTDLRDMLLSLLTRPDDDGRQRLGLLEYLADAAITQTRLGDGGRRTEKSLVKYTDPVTGNEKLERALADGEFLRNRVLAAGGVNARASRLQASIHALLSSWVHEMTETRGVVFVPLRATESQFIGPLPRGWRRLPADYVATTEDMVAWLAENVSAIAADQDAGRCWSEVSNAIERIERVVNRPIPPQFVGPCPTFFDNGQQCRRELRARREATHVKCPQCGATHDVRSVIDRYLVRSQHLRFTIPELEKLLVKLEEPVGRSTLYEWHQKGLLKPDGYRRPDGSTQISRRSDQDRPVFRLANVRKARRMMAEKPRRVKAG